MFGWIGLAIAAALGMAFAWLALPAIALAEPGPELPQANPLRISQVYGGGGNAGSYWTNDFIELLNASATPVNLNGWSVQYASATGSSWQVTQLGNITIQPYAYILVQELQGAGGTQPLPTPDATGTIAMSSSQGKVALVSSVTALSGTCPLGGAVVDFVGYGAANCSETSPMAALSNPVAALRNNNGRTDTDNNSADFTLINPPTPRNSTTPGDELWVTKSGPACVQLGQDLVYTINLRNSASVTATGVVLTDTLPVSTTFVGQNSLVTPVDVGGGVFVWNFGDIPAHITHTFQVTLSTSSSLANGAILTNTVQASTTLPDDPPANNRATTRSAFYLWPVRIHDLQGAGAASPLAGSPVCGLNGIVTSLQPTGFFMQDPLPDGDAATSEGIYVYTGAAPAVSLGSAVAVTATVEEFNGLTELGSLAGLVSSPTSTLITPSLVDLPVAVNLEPYEGMLVVFTETITVSQNYFQGRYGQVTLSAEGRMYNPTNGNGLGDTPEYNQRRYFVLDDNKTGQNPNPIPYIGADNTLRAGDVITGLTGVIDYGLITSDSTTRHYKLQPTQAVGFTRANPRTAAPDTVGGSLKISGFNVLNYFNGDGLGGGFPTARGASNPAEFVRQRTKIISALLAIDADIFGLVEIENDGSGALSAVQDLVNGLNSVAGAGTYALIADPAFIGTDAIKVALIYQPAQVTPIGSTVSSTDTIFSRPPVAQTFMVNAKQARFSVVVNHFKSKGCDGATGLDLDQGDGQGCYNNRRVLQAQALLGFITGLQASSGDPDVLVIGDLNAYGAEDPIDTLVAGGLVNQALAHVPARQRYSYIFDGYSGYLDHALATASLASQVSGMTFWHINADEPSVLDYNTEFKTQDLYTPTPYRSSDHDPTVVGLDLDAVYFIRLPVVLR